MVEPTTRRVALLPTKRGLLARCTGILAFATVAGFLGTLWWPLDLAAHFRVQYAAAAFATGLAALFCRFKLMAVINGGVLLANALVIAPYLMPGGVGASAEEADTLSALLFNVHTMNLRHRDVVEYVAGASADVVILEEVDAAWMKSLETLRPQYPVVRASPRGDNFGIAFLAKVKPDELEVFEIPEVLVPSVRARVTVGGRPLTILGTHAVPPVNQDNARLRNGHFVALADVVKRERNAVLLLGDLNCTPWSRHFSALLDGGGLIDAGRRTGLLLTWPTQFALLRIPIDHCLHTSGVAVVSRRLGPFLGSDHFPMEVRVSVVGLQ